MIKHLPAILIILPLLSSTIVPILGKFKRVWSYYLVVAVTLCSFLISLGIFQEVFRNGPISYWMSGWEPPFGIEYAIDYLNAFVLVVISFIIFVVTIYAEKSVEQEVHENRIPFFYGIYLLFSMGLMGMVVTGDIFNVYVFLEIVSLTSYGLIAVGRNRRALMASLKYLFLGTIGATFFLIGIGYLYMATGSLNMADLGRLLPALYESKVVLTGFAFIGVGLAIKIALFPLHIWLPDAYTYAPSVVSAVMAPTATKVLAYMLIRVIFTVFSIEIFADGRLDLAQVFLVFAVIAMLGGSILAIAQQELKKMLAYSSVSQIGYIVLGLAMLNPTGLEGALLHILNHGLMKASLFLVVGCIVYRTGITRIADLDGMGKKMPLAMAAFTMASLSMIGVPLTVGFVSKWYLALGSIDSGMWFLVPIIVLSSVLTVVYFWRLISNIYFKPPREALLAGGKLVKEEAPAVMLVPTLVLSSLCVVFGVLAFIPVSVTDTIVAFLMR